MKRNTISSLDVAKKCGVSRTTVSFVLNNSPGKRISEETRQKVLKAAEELNYKPNKQARKLALMRHFSIGVFICHSQFFFTDAFIPKVIEGIAQKLNRYRVQLVLQPVKLQQSGYLSLAKREKLDGIILINTHDNDEGLKEIIESEYPVAIIGKISDKNVMQVDIDNRASAKNAVEYLIKLGHRKIAMITHASTIYYAARDRLEGYKEAMEDAGLSINPEWVKSGNFTEVSGYIAMEELLNSFEKPTAVFAGNDVVAYGAIKAIKDKSLNIPDDISIVGFDDDYLSRYLNPPLTTVSVPATGLGSEAAKMLISLIADKQAIKPQQKFLPSYFSVRKSCKKIV